MENKKELTVEKDKFFRKSLNYQTLNFMATTLTVNVL